MGGKETLRSVYPDLARERSTVIESSFRGTIIEISQMPFIFILKKNWVGRVEGAGILRVRSIESASWRPLGDKYVPPVQEQRAMDG
jgi:hypothetical protein